MDTRAELHMRRAGHRKPRPRWGWLYTIVGALLALLGLIEASMPTGVPRRIVETAVVVALFGAMAAWVRINRAALDMARDARPWPLDVIVPVVVVPAGHPQRALSRPTPRSAGPEVSLALSRARHVQQSR
jgi:hypothetical protein